MFRRTIVAGGLALSVALLASPSPTIAQVVFDGLPNQPLGNAQLNSNGSTLTVSNIGSSGKDGVSIDICQTGEGLGVRHRRRDDGREVAPVAGSTGQRAEMHHPDQGPDHGKVRATRRAVSAVSPIAVRLSMSPTSMRRTARRLHSPALPLMTWSVSAGPNFQLA